MTDKSSFVPANLPNGQDVKGNRKWLYPRIVKGKLYQYRSLVSYFFLTLLFAAPIIQVNGEQLILLNVLERKFVFFGIIFWPQDFYLFVLALLTFMVGVVLFTVVFGRIFCGWVCPQTIFLEMVFRKIENFIEGDYIKQRKLDEGPLTGEKIFKKGTKHLIFISISFIISNTFLAYIIGTTTLLKIISDPVGEHLVGFVAICLFTTVFYLVFSKMRELVCILACPYGRLQGVLLDNQSIIVAYDYERGEPRGKHIKNGKANTGDCIDCNICVQVCPTGIDIRNGTQMECTNCTACIDACDMVMDKIDRPRRLIGYKSEDEIKHRGQFKINPRVYAYAAVLAILVSVLSFLLFTRSDVQTTILRAGGTLYQMRDDHTISNLYNAELVNKTNKAVKFKLIPDDPEVKIQLIQQVDELSGGGSAKITFFIILPKGKNSKYKSDIGLKLVSGQKEVDHLTTTFIAPPNF
ncbi:MAG: cytochrome c oxidase accessory protein CcoG [Sphingobacteriaceae bacterium]